MNIIYLSGIYQLVITGLMIKISRFIYGSKYNCPDFMVSGGVVYRIVSNHLGSPVLVVEVSTGAIMQQIEYDEFGNIISDTNPGFQPFGFAGGIYDNDTGLTRFGVRDYDSVVGRWTCKDPIGFGGGLNWYGYCVSDPVNYVDLLGYNSCIVFNGEESSIFSKKGGTVIGNYEQDFYIGNGNFKVINSKEIIIKIYPGRVGSTNIHNKLQNGKWIGDNLRPRTHPGMTCDGGKGWSLDLKPTFPCSDPATCNLIRIHPDSNDDGTEGCIGVSCAFQQEMYDDLGNNFNKTNENSILVIVNIK
jgi:RHS repeat-associated protein